MDLETSASVTSDTSPTSPSTESTADTSLPSGGDFDVGGLDFDSDLDGVVVPKAEPVAAAPKPAPAPVPTPAPAQPTAAAPAPAPAPAQVTPQPQPQAAPAAPNAEAIVSTPEGFLQSFEQGRENMIKIFAEQTFALNDADREALETNPAEIVPQLMGRALFAAISSAQRLMMTQLPHMIAAHTETTGRQGAAQNAFYEAFPDLKNDSYTPAIQKYADFYKSQFPDLPLADRIQAIGTWARQHFKLQPPAPAATAAPPKTPKAPHVVQQTPFMPAAAAGGAVRGGPVSADDDPFAGAMLDYD